MNALHSIAIAAILLLISLVGCKASPTATDEGTVEPAVEAEAPHAEDAHAEDTDSAAERGEDQADDHDHHARALEGKDLVLNDGEKWSMDEHTRKLVAEMNETVDNATVESHEDAQKVAKTLSSQLQALINGCTMTGEAHDNLHVFLATFLPAVNRLETAESNEDARKHFSEVTSQLDTYDEYFE